MPEAVAKTVQPAAVVQAADLAVRVEVGDVADLRDGEPAPAGACGGTADLERTELPSEVAQLRIGQVLVTQDHYCEPIDCEPGRGDVRGVDGPAQIEPGDLGGKRRL